MPKNKADRSWATVLVVGSVILLAGSIAYLRLRGSPDDDNQQERAETITRSAPSSSSNDGDGGRPAPGKRMKPPGPKVRPPITKSGLPALRPHRFVALYGEASKRAPGRSKQDARKLVESFRDRVLAGEEAGPIIAKQSDPPFRVPMNLISRYEDLDPGQVSPIVPVEDGFAVFAGTRPGELMPGLQ